jgi:hypothetical protein
MRSSTWVLSPSSSRGPRVDLAQVSIAIRAHQLATAQEFQELLSLALLTGVESYTYQLETVRRVVRVLRGRALLADEVGLGKTIEAKMPAVLGKS